MSHVCILIYLCEIIMKHKKYQHIFFDLDHTIWDFDKNAAIVLKRLFEDCSSALSHISFIDFFNSYVHHNDQLWGLYREDGINQADLRSGRFKLSLADFGVTREDVIDYFTIEYPKQAPLQTHLFPYSMEVLNYLSSKYELHLITNGFEEVQHIKLNNCGLTDYFKTVTTSQNAGVKKPNPKIFEYALQSANAAKVSSIMIGDSIESDCLGAKNVGLDQIYFNPKKMDCKHTFTAQIYCLSELKKIL
mgnify:CR=1 FL=1